MYDAKYEKEYVLFNIHQEEDMVKDQQQIRKFLEPQLKWCKEQDYILEQIEMKLYEMKEITQYTIDNELSTIEVEHLNGQINQLKKEVHSLEAQI